jgi:hypothetical protein
MANRYFAEQSPATDSMEAHAEHEASNGMLLSNYINAYTEH